MTLPQGQIIGNRYRVVSLLRQGGMGAVYRALDIRLDVAVALKEMLPQPGLDAAMLAQLRQQFQQEATVLAHLSHPHLVAVTDFFEEEGNAYLVMKFVEGENLAERIGQAGPLPEAHVLSWAGQLLDALDHCHSRGLIHRDVKPQNVIITPEGQAVLVDFGLVKLWDPRDPRTRTAMRGMGTPEYAPPEQYSAQAGHTDPRSDLYSVGATLYHALAGQAPLTATDRMADPHQFVSVRALNPHVSPRTEAAVLRAMELPRDQRFQTAQEMAGALGVGTPAPPPPAPPERPPAKVTREVPPAAPKRRRTKVMPREQPVSLPWRQRVPVWAWPLGALALLIVALVAFLAARPAPKTARPTPTTGGPALATGGPAPASTIFLTSNRDGKQEVYRLTGAGQAERVTHTPGSGESGSPILMSDGTLFFTSNRDGKWEIYHLTSIGEVERVTHTPGNGESWSPAPAPDGSFLFTSNRDGKREIYHMTSAGEVDRVTHTPGNGESWSPVFTSDGTFLFTSNRDGKQEVYHMTSTGEVERVTRTPGKGASWSPAPAPDGSFLFASNRDGKREIYHMTSAGKVERVTHTPGNGESWSPVFAPDGTFLFTSNRDGKREVYHLTSTGEVERVTYTPGNGESWSPVR